MFVNVPKCSECLEMFGNVRNVQKCSECSEMFRNVKKMFRNVIKNYTEVENVHEAR